MSAAYSPLTEAGLRRWAREQPWTRTNTARWLNERSAAVLAHYEKEHGILLSSRASSAAGYRLQERLPKNFDAIHGKLAAAEGDRDALTLEEVLP